MSTPTIFSDVCGSQSSFLSNSTVLSWARTESSNASLPLDLVLAQWIAEGANVCSASSCKCNNPANAGYGTFARSGCAQSYTTDYQCSSNPPFASVGTALYGAEMIAAVYNAGFCQVAQAFQNSSLTAGGQELYDYAKNNHFTILQNGTYNAAYALGVSGWDGTGDYQASNYGGATPSTVAGSAIIYFIEANNLSGYDSIA